MRTCTLLLCASLILMVGCAPDRDDASALYVPDGDPVRGEVVFVELGCHSCHTVEGIGFPRPVADPPVGVDLAGIAPSRCTKGALATSIMAPSHQIAFRYAGGPMTSGGHSRMGDFSEVMTLRQMVDLVAFLQDRNAEAVDPGA